MQPTTKYTVHGWCKIYNNSAQQTQLITLASESQRNESSNIHYVGNWQKTDKWNALYNSSWVGHAWDYF